MKKTILVLLLPWLLFGAADTCITSGLWSVNENWSEAVKPGATDTAIHKTGINDTMNEDFSIAAYRCPPVSGTYRMDSSIHVDKFFVDSGTGTAKGPDSLIITGANGYFRNSSGNGTRSYTSTVMYYDCQNGQHNEYKGNIYLKAIIGDGDTLTYSGGTQATYTSDVSSSPLNFINGGKLVLNSQVTFTKGSTSGDIVSFLGATPEITGNSNFILQGQLSGGTFTIPGMTIGGTVLLRLNSTLNSSSLLKHEGNLSVYELYVRPVTGSVQWTWDGNDQNFTLTNMYVGSAVGTSTLYTRFGNGTYTISGKLDMSTNNLGTEIDSLEGATINIGTNLTIGSAHTIVPGTSEVVSTGAGTWTTNSEPLFDGTRNSTSSSFLIFGDSTTWLGDYTLLDGPFDAGGYGMYIAGSLIHSSVDSTRYQNVVCGNYIRAAGADKNDTSGQHLIFYAGASHTAALANKTYARITLNGPTALNGGATIAALSYGVDGVKGTVESGTTLNIGALSCGGTSGSPDSLLGDGGVATLSTGSNTIMDAASYLNLGNLSLSNPIENAGYLTVSDGKLYMNTNGISCVDFTWSSADSLAWDGDITCSGNFTFEGSGNFSTTGNLTMTGTGNFDWEVNMALRRFTGTMTMGSAGQTVTWVVPGATNRYPIFGAGGKLIVPDATGDIAGYLTFAMLPADGDTVWNLNGAALSADSGEVEMSVRDPGHVYIPAFNAANVYVNVRPYHSSDTVFVHYLGDLTISGANLNSQYSNEAYHYLGTYTYTIGTDGFRIGNNGTAHLTQAIRTSGTFTDAGAFTIDDEVDFSAGTGTYSVGGNLSIGSGTNDLGTASWTLTGTSTVSVKDTIDSLYIASTATITQDTGLYVRAMVIDSSATYTQGANDTIYCPVCDGVTLNGHDLVVAYPDSCYASARRSGSRNPLDIRIRFGW